MLERLIPLIGEENLKKLNTAKILLVGVGGVGGFILEALVRSGINNITVIDGDKFTESNLNRQILSLKENIDSYKVDEAIKRAKSINPNINIKGINKYIDSSNINNLESYDYIIDACDDVLAKVALIKYAKDNNIKIICALGTGKRLNPSYIKQTTLNKTINDPLAKKMREELKKANIKLDIPVVYSEELPINKDKTIYSSIFVPGTAGLYIAYFVISDIINKQI